jgi:biotin-(acetyl-CoA carboxylase) ligase
VDKFKCESLLPFIDEFESKDLFLNQIVHAFSGKNTVCGRNIGITNEGYLKLLDLLGNELIIYSGDISIRVI